MTFLELTRFLGKQGYFDLPTVAQLTDEKRGTLRVQLSRWCKSGKLSPLRRGMYAFPEEYCPVSINPVEMANRLYTPSYLSRHWALGYYGLLPEGVVTYTSVTTRVPKTFRNVFGTFRYQNVKRSAFFGYQSVDLGGHRVLIAEPEKALLDLWHLEKGAWTRERLREMRFQNTTALNVEKLNRYAKRFDSPRLIQAADLWPEIAAVEEDGTVTL